MANFSCLKRTTGLIARGDIVYYKPLADFRCRAQHEKLMHVQKKSEKGERVKKSDMSKSCKACIPQLLVPFQLVGLFQLQLGVA